MLLTTIKRELPLLITIQQVQQQLSFRFYHSYCIFHSLLKGRCVYVLWLVSFGCIPPYVRWMGTDLKKHRDAETNEKASLKMLHTHEGGPVFVDDDAEEVGRPPRTSPRISLLSLAIGFNSTSCDLANAPPIDAARSKSA